MPIKKVPAPMVLKHLRPTDARGLVRLATQATLGVTRIAEGVHQSVWKTLGAPGGEPGQARGITGLTYRTVNGVTSLIGKGLESAIGKLEPLLESLMEAPGETPQRQAMLAALNGVMGDRLAADHNPLAIPMTLRYQGQALDWQTLRSLPAVTGKVLLLIHGLCMSDLQWHSQADSADSAVADHGAALATSLGYTPIYLRYNTGLHTSQNGHQLAALLEQLIAHWPVPVEDLTVVVHSMGGLVIRSAVHYAKQDALRWPIHLKNIVFLGTPHHGAPFERAGNWVDVILGSTPYTKPLARVGQLRSAGITDLRYGHVLDEDWQGHDRFRRSPDKRRAVPLPEGVACYTIAATAAAKRSPVADRLIGDGLVPLPSALGQHDDPARQLAFDKASQWIAYSTSHIGLLSSPDVTRQIVAWLKKA
jgi:hypothetical protein